MAIHIISRLEGGSVNKNKDGLRTAGFILVLTFFIMSAAILVTTYLLNRFFAGEKQSSYFQDHEQAKMLALGGIELVKSRLDLLESTHDEKVMREQQKWLLMSLNEWNELRFSQKIDGIDGSIKIYISCEDGKININRFFDASKKQYLLTTPEHKAFSAFLSTISTKQFGISLTDQLEKALKKQSTRLDDLSELLATTAFSEKGTDYFLFPYLLNEASGEKKTKAICLGDLLTLYSEEIWRVHPLYMSKSLQTFFGLKSFPQNKGEREKLINSIVEKLQRKMDWPTSWDALLASVYGKKFAQLDPQLKILFGAVGGARTFSVVCYGKFGEQSQGVCALLQRRLGRDNQAFYVVRKFYWI